MKNELAYSDMVGNRILFRYNIVGYDPEIIHEATVLEHALDSTAIHLLKIREEEVLHTGLLLKEYWLPAHSLIILTVLPPKEKKHG